MGSWSRAEAYAKDILDVLNHWTSGWVDWNLALNEEGGPNWSKSYVDAPIIVNASKQEYYRQPMWYVLSHFSKFLPPGSVRLEHKQQVYNATGKEPENLHTVCFRTPDGRNVLIALNQDQKEMSLQISAGNQGSFNVLLNGKSVCTYVWKEKKIRHSLITINALPPPDPAMEYFDYRAFLGIGGL